MPERPTEVQPITDYQKKHAAMEEAQKKMIPQLIELNDPQVLTTKDREGNSKVTTLKFALVYGIGSIVYFDNKEDAEKVIVEEQRKFRAKLDKLRAEAPSTYYSRKKAKLEKAKQMNEQDFEP